MFAYILVLILGLSFSVDTASGNKKLGFSHSLDLGQDVLLRWEREDEVTVRMEMSAPSSGYVAIGFSPNGGMRGSDIVMGWVDDKGVGHIKVSRCKYKNCL